MGTGRTTAVGARAVGACVRTVAACARRVVAGRTVAIRANALCARVCAVGAAALVALVVVHAVVGHVLPMHVTVVQVVDVVPVHDRVVTAAGTVGVAMYFRRSMLNRRHWTQPLADLMPEMLICAEVHDKSKRHKTSIQVTAAVAGTPSVSGANADTPRPTLKQNHAPVARTVWINTDAATGNPFIPPRVQKGHTGLPRKGAPIPHFSEVFPHSRRLPNDHHCQATNDRTAEHQCRDNVPACHRNPLGSTSEELPTCQDRRHRTDAGQQPRR